MRRCVFVVFVGLVLTSMVFGSGGREEPADQGVVLEFWLRDTRPSNVEAMDQIVALFEEQNPGVTVEVVLTPWDSVEQKTATAIASDTLPDLAQLNQTGVADYGARGVLLNIDDRMRSWDRIDDIVDISLGQGQYQGEYLGVPWFAGSNVMFYNKDLFVQEGIVDANGEADPPETWDEFLAVAERLTKDSDGDGTIDQWGFVVRGDVSLTIPVREFMLAAGDGDMVDTATNAVVIDTPANLEGLQFYVDLYREWGVVPPDTPSVDYVAEEQYFLSGNVAMMFNGPWNLGNMYESDINWGVALEPRSNRHAAHIGGTPVGIFASTDHPDEAWKFAQFLVSDEAQRIWSIEYGVGLPVTRHMLDEAKTDPVVAVFADSLESADRDGVTPPPQIPQWVTIERSIAPPILQSALLGEISPQTALRDLQAAVEEAVQ